MKALKRLTQALRERGVNAENVFVGFHFALFALALLTAIVVVFKTFWGALMVLLTMLFAVALLFFTEATVILLVLGYALWKFGLWISPILARGLAGPFALLLAGGAFLLGHWAQALAVVVLAHAAFTLYRTGKSSTHHP
ncbi:MAG: hypothetical protein RL760_398 [Candidatus Eisenbacteria bacterium]|jgi:hypothetical protein